MRSVVLALVLLLLIGAPGPAQVLIRVGDPHRATYSELHEALREDTPAADSVLAGTTAWNDAPLALTRLAELRDAAYADSAARLAGRIETGAVKAPPGQDPADLLAPLHAVALERWIGTRPSRQALLEARARARARGTYADPSLARGGYDFLANDSSAVISRTGRWLTEWVGELEGDCGP